MTTLRNWYFQYVGPNDFDAMHRFRVMEADTRANIYASEEGFDTLEDCIGAANEWWDEYSQGRERPTIMTDMINGDEIPLS